MFTPPNSADEPLSLIAQCYVIAARRGRALREARERAALAAEETPNGAQVEPNPTQPSAPDTREESNRS